MQIDWAVQIYDGQQIQITEQMFRLKEACSGDPRGCRYDVMNDKWITHPLCKNHHPGYRLPEMSR